MYNFKMKTKICVSIREHLTRADKLMMMVM